MVAAPESMAHVGARLARTPVVGVAIIAYLAGAFIVIGSEGSSPAREVPAAHDAGVVPSAAPPVRAKTSNAPHIDDGTTRDEPPAEQIDPQFLAGLQKVLDGLDEQAGQDRPRPAPQDADQSPSPAAQPDTPASDTTVPSTAPPALQVADVDGQGPQAPALDPSTAATQAVDPTSQAEAPSNGQSPQPVVPQLPGPGG